MTAEGRLAGTRTPGRTHRFPVLLAYGAFILVGVGAGVSGVLLLEQLRDYGVSRSTIGITFFTGSAGFVLAGITSGPMIHRLGFRASLLLGGVAFMAANFYTATRPPFVALVLVQVVAGYGTGMLESVLNAYLAALPNSTTLLNRLHAFFGVGALIGPVLATRLLRHTDWPTVALVLALACVPLTVGFLLTYPGTGGGAGPAGAAGPDDGGPHDRPHDRPHAEIAPGGLLGAALRQPAVLLAGLLLTVYVGLELGLGNWVYSYLVEARDQGAVAAGYTVSGYWLGLTLGRFLISPVATRIGLTDAGLMYTCLAGVVAAAALTWLAPVALVASGGLVLLGFFLGPIFPTTMAIAPALTERRLVPTAIGVINAGSVVGGAALPWLAGATAQGIGIWTLLPFGLALAVLQLLVWWRLAARIRRPAQLT